MQKARANHHRSTQEVALLLR